MKHAGVAVLAVFLAGCVTVPKGEVDDLKPAMRALYQSFRWKDFRGAADLMVAERRDAFVKARKTLNDDRDLFVTNFELEDAKLSADLLTARAVTRLSWYRLPSSTEQTVTVMNVFIWREGLWQLESMDDGPFDELLPDKEKEKEKAAKLKASAADAGVPAAP
jgi:hypothetical protein